MLELSDQLGCVFGIGLTPIGANLEVWEHKIAALSLEIKQAVETAGGSPWSQRKDVSLGLLRSVHDLWWDRHEQEPMHYQSELQLINTAANWTGEKAQKSQWCPFKSEGSFFAPPKFLGCSFDSLTDDFVLALSLNHKLATEEKLVAEAKAQEQRGTAWTSHVEYFEQPYAYGTFFKRRHTVLSMRDRPDRGWEQGGAEEDWLSTNRNSLYVEVLPTRSNKQALIPQHAASILDSTWLMRLNQLVINVAFDVMCPRYILVAGKLAMQHVERLGKMGNWNVSRFNFQDPVWNADSPDFKVAHPTANQKVATLLTDDTGRRCVKCYFLATVSGPNSHAEKRRVGRLLFHGEQGMKRYEHKERR